MMIDVPKQVNVSMSFAPGPYFGIRYGETGWYSTLLYPTEAEVNEVLDWLQIAVSKRNWSLRKWGRGEYVIWLADGGDALQFRLRFCPYD